MKHKRNKMKWNETKWQGKSRQDQGKTFTGKREKRHNKTERSDENETKNRKEAKGKISRTKMIILKWNGITIKGQMRLVLFRSGTLKSKATPTKYEYENTNVIANIKVDVAFKRDEIRFTASA